MIHASLKASTGQATVPYVFVGGKLLGGCSDTKARAETGELDTALHAAGALVGVGGDVTRARDVALPPPEPPAASPSSAAVYHALLNFPDTVDGNVIRGVALQVCALSIAIVVLRDTAAGRWLAVATLADFALRFSAGAAASPLGVIAIAAVARMRPSLSAGPPKQFAAGVGILFSAAGVAATWGDSSEIKVGAAVVWSVLALFAALEGFLNFCAGCRVFGQAIRVGLLPPSMYRIHVTKQAEVAWQWDEALGWHDTPPPPPPPAVAGALRGTGERLREVWRARDPMATDVSVRTGKDDAARRRDFNPVKHVRFGMFNAALSVAGLAQVWRAVASGVFGSPSVAWGVSGVWQVLAALAAAIWVALALLTALKAVFYWRRLVKDFWHPSDAAQSSFPFVTLCIFAGIAASAAGPDCPGCSTLAYVLVWAGAGPMLLLAFLRVADMISVPVDEDALNPSWMVAPVGLFVAAQVLPVVDAAYNDIASFFFAYALMSWAVLFILQLSKRLRTPSVDCRVHPQWAGFVAAPAVAATAYVGLASAGSTGSATAALWIGLFPRVLLWIALGMYATLVLTFRNGFLGACCFSMMVRLRQPRGRGGREAGSAAGGMVVVCVSGGGATLQPLTMWHLPPLSLLFKESSPPPHAGMGRRVPDRKAGTGLDGVLFRPRQPRDSGPRLGVFRHRERHYRRRFRPHRHRSAPWRCIPQRRHLASGNDCRVAAGRGFGLLSPLLLAAAGGTAADRPARRCACGLSPRAHCTAICSSTRTASSFLQSATSCSAHQMPSPA